VSLNLVVKCSKIKENQVQIDRMTLFKAELELYRLTLD